MKTFQWFLLISLFVSVPLVMEAQSRGVRKFCQKYKRTEGATNIKVPGLLMKTGLGIAKAFVKEEEEKELLKLISSIGGIRILNIEDANPVASGDIKDMLKSVRRKNYQDILSVHADGEQINLMVREKKDKIKGFFVMVSGADEFIMFSLKGKIRYSALNKILKSAMKDKEIKMPDVIRA